MLRSIEVLERDKTDIYTDMHNVLVLPIPYVNDSTYIVTGSKVHAKDVEYLRLVDQDTTGIYEWYLYRKDNTYHTLYGVKHTLDRQPVIILSKLGIGNFIKDFNVSHVDEYEPSYPPATKHVVDYYLTTIAGELGIMFDEYEYGRDLSSMPRYTPTTSVNGVAIEFNQASDVYAEVLRWFDINKIYKYTPSNVKQLLAISQQIGTDAQYTGSFSGMYSRILNWCSDNSIPTNGGLLNYLSDGYIERSELTKLSNLKDTQLSRRFKSLNTDKYITNLDNGSNLPQSIINRIAICPVREFSITIGENGRIFELMVNDIYGYSRVLLDAYFSVLSHQLHRQYRGLKFKVIKTWDNQVIVTIGNGSLGIELTDITTSFVAGVELVHVY